MVSAIPWYQRRSMALCSSAMVDGKERPMHQAFSYRMAQSMDSRSSQRLMPALSDRNGPCRRQSMEMKPQVLQR